MFSRGDSILCCARRLSRRALEVFFLGTAMGRRSLAGTVAYRWAARLGKGSDEATREDQVESRTLGSEGLEVSEQGLGCMGMSAWYGPTDEAESIATIHRALELGISFLDTADVYGQGANEELVGRAIAGKRDEMVLATKFGNRWFDDGRRTTRCPTSLRREGRAHLRPPRAGQPPI